MIDSSTGSLTRAVELRAAPSTIDMKPIASFGPQTSTTLSPMTISTTPDCTTYMQVPGSPLLKTTPPAGNVTLTPAPRAKALISTSVTNAPPTQAWHRHETTIQQPDVRRAAKLRAWGARHIPKADARLDSRPQMQTRLVAAQ